MHDAPEAEPQESPYIRLPWALVAAVLAGVLVVALAAGLYANRYLRPQLQIATPIPLATATPAIARTVAPAPAPTSIATAPAPTSIATAAPTAEPLPGATVSAATLPAPQPTFSTPAASTSVATSIDATLMPASEPTISPELEDEVGNAYQHYWDVRAEALLDLDSTHLPEVMAGEHLTSVEKFIEQLRSEGHALLTDVDHKYAVVSASVDAAEIVDTYTDTSVYVDPNSHAVLSQPANDVLQEQYQMARIDGTWRVISLVRAP